MSPDTDRIAVPTNGHGPPPEPEPIEPQASERSTPERLASGAPTAPFNPTQLLLGFAIVASIVAIVARRLRRRNGGRPGPADGG